MNTAASVEATVTSVASKGMGGGTATTFFGWITDNEVLAIIGLVTTLSGFMVNLYFQRRRDQREERELSWRHQLQIDEDRRRKELHDAELAALAKE